MLIPLPLIWNFTPDTLPSSEVFFRAMVPVFSVCTLSHAVTGEGVGAPESTSCCIYSLEVHTSWEPTFTSGIALSEDTEMGFKTGWVLDRVN